MCVCRFSIHFRLSLFIVIRSFMSIFLLLSCTYLSTLFVSQFFDTLSISSRILNFIQFGVECSNFGLPLLMKLYQVCLSASRRRKTLCNQLLLPLLCDCDRLCRRSFFDLLTVKVVFVSHHNLRCTDAVSRRSFFIAGDVGRTISFLQGEEHGFKLQLT